MSPVEALKAIDRIIGNEKTISADRLGEVRGIVLDTLNEYFNPAYLDHPPLT